MLNFLLDTYKNGVNDKEVKSKTKGGDSDYKGAAKAPPSGGAKGSSVYVNFKAYTDKEVEEFK